MRTATDCTLPADSPRWTFFQRRGAEFVADQPVQHPSRLLGIHEIHVEVPRVLERFLDCVRGYLVEHNTAQGATINIEMSGGDEVP